MTVDNSGTLHVVYIQFAPESVSLVPVAVFSPIETYLKYATCKPSSQNSNCGNGGWTSATADTGTELGWTSLFTDGTNLYAGALDEFNDIAHYSTCVIANGCTNPLNWVPDDGWVYTNSYGASTSSVLDMTYDMPLKILATP